MFNNIVRASMRPSAAASLLLLTLAGCIPVGWLPDSSGFVYIDGKDLEQLVLYDVAKGERRVLVEKLPASTAWPAVSPDGKQIAVARLVRDKAQPRSQSMQVILYDLQGKEVHRSPEFNWTKTGKEGGEDHLLLTAIFWDAASGKLLVHDFEDNGKTGIYDPAKKSMVVIDGWAAPFGGTPVRPDGKGFLITRQQGDDLSGVFLVDWEGKAVPIEMKPETLDSKEKRDFLRWPWGGSSVWRGNVAEVSYRTSRIRIDTANRTGALENIPKEEATVDGKEIVQQYTFPDGARVRVLLDDTAQKRYQVEFLKPGDKKAKLLKSQEQGFIVSPSPNQKWLAVRSFDDNKGIVLVNSKGEVREIAGVK